MKKFLIILFILSLFLLNSCSNENDSKKINPDSITKENTPSDISLSEQALKKIQSEQEKKDIKSVD